MPYLLQSFLVRFAPRNPRSETSRVVWSKGYLPPVKEDELGEHVNKLDINKVTGPDGMHP